eukprot:9798568-Alexandrium_andersonii.AAC.1
MSVCIRFCGGTCTTQKERGHRQLPLPSEERCGRSRCPRRGHRNIPSRVGAVSRNLSMAKFRRGPS